MIRHITNVIRRAVVTNVNYNDGFLYTRWLDDDSIGPKVPIPHPFANKGGSGIYVGIKIGTLLALAMSSHKIYIPVAIIPIMSSFNSDAASIPEADFDDVSLPQLYPGDIVIQGPTGSQLRLNNSNVEEVILSNEFGEGIILGGGSNSFRCSVNISSPVNYTISNAGIKAIGIIRRDVKTEDVEESFVDFLTGLDSEQTLEEIGWNPNKQITYSLCGQSNKSSNGQEDTGVFRNPPFVENRQLTYEFGRDWMVGTYNEEEKRLKDPTPNVDSENRNQRRSNVLSLSQSNPSELIEKIEGTVVDIFGNLLDINRRIIDIPKGDSKEETLKDIFEKTRHTIAYHMEINTKKGYRYDDTIDKTIPVLFTDTKGSLSSVSNSSRDRSRWFIDVDKEGLTKINIPSTSETGNVPLITKYENSSVLNIDYHGNPIVEGREQENVNKLYRNEKNRDIFTEQIGPGGIDVNGDVPDNRMNGMKVGWVDTDGEKTTQKTMNNIVQAGTAFHDITTTAWRLIKENINKKASDILENGVVATKPGLKAVSSDINSKIPKNNEQPNAGGRSLHMNLDGSMETSIGANTRDRISWILDTAGAIVWRLGRDKSGRSAIVHADGYIAIEVGGFDYIGESPDDKTDTRFVGKGKSRKDTLELDPHQFRSGKIVIKVRRAKEDSLGPEEDDSLLIIDESGLTIQTPGRLNIISGQDMTLESKSRITLEAPKVQIYRSSPRYLSRDGRRI